MIWALFTRQYCAIARISDGIAITECRDVHSSADVDVIAEQPAHEVRCKARCAGLVDRRIRELGVEGWV